MNKLITLVVLAVLLVSGLFFYNYYNTLRDERIDHEVGLNAQYPDNQNLLSEFVSGFYEQIGISNLKSEKIDKILKDALTGKFGDQGFKSNGSFISAFQEAGIDLTGLNIYDKIIDYVQAKRPEFKNAQTNLLARINAYNAWRTRGAIRSLIIKYIVKAPSQQLEARVGDKTYNGAEALEKMKQIVLTQKAVDAYDKGVMAPLNPSDVK